MKYFFILTVTLSINCSTNSSKLKTSSPSSVDTVPESTISINDTTIEKLKGGIYLAFPDTIKSKGLKLLKKDEYYFLVESPVISLKEIDSVFKEFNPHIERYTLIFKFKEPAIKKWFDFTTQYNGMKVGLVLKEQLYHIATIASPISSGETVITNATTEQEIDDFKEFVEKEITKAKGL